jgi:hypothetical protein
MLFYLNLYTTLLLDLDIINTYFSYPEHQL